VSKAETQIQNHRRAFVGALSFVDLYNLLGWQQQAQNKMDEADYHFRSAQQLAQSFQRMIEALETE
jgi:hypothetical protein